jgi:predicted DNA binding protein
MDIDRTHSASVRISDVRRSPGTEEVHDLVEISSPKEHGDSLIRVLKDSENVRSVDLVRVEPHRTICTVTSKNCPVCPALLGLDCFILSATTNGTGQMEWSLLLNDGARLEKITDRLTSEGVKHSLLEVKRLSSRKALTLRQEQVLEMALQLGYFDFPRKTNLAQLSRKLAITQGTLSEILRRAEKNALTERFSHH